MRGEVEWGGGREDAGGGWGRGWAGVQMSPGNIFVNTEKNYKLPGQII